LHAKLLPYCQYISQSFGAYAPSFLFPRGEAAAEGGQWSGTKKVGITLLTEPVDHGKLDAVFILVNRQSGPVAKESYSK
jgi:hypothetical protein